MGLASIRNNFFFRSFSDLSSKGMALASTVLLARHFKPEGWGAMQYCFSFAGLFGVLADLGLGSLVVREIARASEKARSSWLLAALIVKTVLWLVAGTLLFAAVLLEGQAQEAGGLMGVAALWTLASSLGDFNSVLFSARERLDLDAFFSLSSKAGQTLVILFSIYWKTPLKSALLGMTAVTFAAWFLGFSSLVAGYGLSWERTENLMEKIFSLLKGLWPFGLAAILIPFYFKIDTVILGHLAGAGAVGVYQGAYKWFDSLGFLPGAVVAAVFPGLVRAEGSGEKGKEKQLRVLRLVGALSCFVAFALYVFGDLIVVFLGHQYEASASLLEPLCWSIPFLFPNYIFISLLVACRRQGWILLGAVLGSIANVGGNFWLIPLYGAKACSLMTFATEIVVFCCSAAALNEAFPIKSYLKPLLGWLSAALIGFCILAFGRRHGLLYPGLALCLAVSFTILWLAKILTYQDFRDLIPIPRAFFGKGSQG